LENNASEHLRKDYPIFAQGIDCEFNDDVCSIQAPSMKVRLKTHNQSIRCIGSALDVPTITTKKIVFAMRVWHPFRFAPASPSAETDDVTDEY